MSLRRQNRVSTLAIVLPHPPLLRRRSSLLSQGSINSPHTPRTSNCASPTCQSWLFANNNNRKSTDSWNSSNQDVGEDCESEWKPDQILLLSRTLDALPSHLVTPFNGPIPPSNLLDKIARGVANAKGPAEWPHSLRATRVKLIEIARQRAKEDPPRGPKSVVTDENDDISCYSTDSDLNAGLSRKRSRVIPRRPLYRQSSMDFVNPGDRKNGDNITRLSTRLQRTDSLVPNPNYHPYTRSRARAQTQSQTQARIDQMNRRSSSPPRPAHVPSLISPSTPSSSTLNSFSSLSTSAARRHVIRRSASTFSSSDSSMISGNRSSLADSEVKPHLLPSVLPDPIDARVQRVRRSESFYNPPYSASNDNHPFVASARTPPSTHQAFKRAPSYGALVQEAREREKEKRSNGAVPHIYGSKSREEMNVSPCPSSDEEEKLRNNQAKKVKGPGGKASRSPAAPLPPDSRSSDQGKAKKHTKAKDAVCSESKATSYRLKSPPPPASISAVVPTQPLDHPRPQMNLQHSSIFGEELPHLHIPAAPSRPIPSASSSSSNQRPTATPSQPAGPPRKTLRRVKRLAPSRKISFGSLIAPNGNDTDIEDDKGGQHPKLGSAFQLS
ncbi:hypothetical protein C8R41DRAFT_913933 [Lentinula lateritia]|uniref:Uncharacterized protein n=1 Tax=Lentinula lateritia TaxID=40482 RepID=A0ABQ8VXW8_9AGAR|nr:hypothetical protein C8R41DRAFT_913933 [Lentinula lateritia]